MLKQSAAKLKIDEIVRSRRRTISLEITRDGRLVIRAPIGTPKHVIEDAVEQKRSWILEKQANAGVRDKKHAPKSCVDGESFELLGENLTLCIERNATKITASDGKLHVPVQYGAAMFEPESRKAAMQRAITEWYKVQAYEVLKQRVDYYAQLANVHYTSLKITSALSRWGSCSAGGRLCFTWRLVMAPVDMIDYVAVHELTHISHPDHSRAFWHRVGELMPDYTVRREWFRQNSALMRPDYFKDEI